MGDRKRRDRKIADIIAVFMWMNGHRGHRGHNDFSVFSVASVATSFLFLASIFLFLLAPGAIAQTIRVNPTGVNVNISGATTVFLTFGPVGNFRPAEGTWCGELIPATPDNGLKCDPATIFGSLPGRFNRSRSSGNLGFTDIMSIPPSVARRAYQAAQAGSVSSFFYVRRFINLGGGPDRGPGGPDEYVPVTCRLSGGGARTPFALTDVKVSFDTDASCSSRRAESLPP
jgi:hypothetical protein